MDLKFETALHCKIADLMWVAETQQEVDALIKVFGHDAIVVHQMIIASVMDTENSTSLAKQVLDKIFNKE